MCQPPAPPPPDYGPIIAASSKASEAAQKLAQEQFDWAKQAYASDKQVTDKVTDEFLSTMDLAKDNAVKDRQRYESTFQPLEDQLVAESQDYATPERKAQEMGRAQAGVAQQFDAKRTAATQQLESFGINPSATRFAALDMGIRATQAAAEAAAADTASRNVDDKAEALRATAIDIGRGMPAQVNQSLGVSGNAGQGAAGTTNNATTVGANTMGTSATYSGIASNALSAWGGALGNSYDAAMAKYKADSESSSGVGSLLGLVGGVAGKAFGLNNGGIVPGKGYGNGGVVKPHNSPTMGAIPDDVPAKLTAGEMVIPKDVVGWFGQKHFFNLMDKAGKERGEAIATTGARPRSVPAGIPLH